MKRKGITGLIGWLIVIFPVICMMFCAEAKAQELLTGRRASKAAEAISAGYDDWNTASWTAKVRCDLLPVSVTMRTYMCRDSLTLISLRAPLFGEAARIEIDNDAILVINKMKKCYARIELSSYGELPAKVHSDIQDIFTGRVAILGSGTLSKSNYKEADIYGIGEEGYLVTCALPEEFGGANYGYGVDSESRIVMMMATKGKVYGASAPEGMRSETEEISMQLAADVKWTGLKADSDITALVRGKNFEASLEGMKIEWDTTGFKRIEIGKGYTQKDIRDVIRF